MEKENCIRSLKRMMTILAGSSILVGCSANSDVEFGESRRGQINATVSVESTAANHQGGVVTGVTARGYKVSASLGAPTNRVQGATDEGSQIRLNLQGQIAQ